MVNNGQDVLIRAFAMLTALRKNIAEINYGVQETFVREFHSTLDKVEAIGISVSEFRIPDSEVKPRVLSVHMGGGRTYSDEKYVDKSFILTKLDAVLDYLEIITSEKPRKMGFRKGDEG